MFNKLFLFGIFVCFVANSFEVNAVDGTSIGSVFQCAHDFRGEVFVKNDREITIKGMNYDGKGPAAWFHGQLKGSKGVYTSDGNYMTLPYPNDSCERLKPGKVYKDEDVSLILPVSITEFETIGIFCYQYCHNFGHIVIPKDMNFTAAPADLLKPEGCPKPSYSPCSLEKTKSRNGDIMPDCPAGAEQLIPNMIVLLIATILTSVLVSFRN